VNPQACRRGCSRTRG